MRSNVPVIRSNLSPIKGVDGSLNFEYLHDIQGISYNKFLYGENGDKSDLQKAIESAFPISDSFGYATLEFVSHRIDAPKYSPETCLKKSLTYSADVYTTLRLVLFSVDVNGDRQFRSAFEQEVMFCNVPLMTNDNVFIVNGIRRNIISQIHKSPGIFFSRSFTDNVYQYSAGIVPYKGRWLDVMYDNKNSLFFRIDKKRKLPISLLLKALGQSNSEIIKEYYEPFSLKHKDNGVYEIDFNLKSILGATLMFNIYNESGEVILKYGSIVTHSILQKHKDVKFFITDAEIAQRGLRLYEDVVVQDICAADCLTEVNPTLLKKFVKLNISEFKVLNIYSKDFCDGILKSVVLDKNLTTEDALREVILAMNPNEQFVSHTAQEAFENEFFNQANYDLFDVGRYKINSILRHNTEITTTVLQKEDIIACVKKLVYLKQNNIDTDDVDHLGNRRVRSVGELVQNQLMIGLKKISKYAVEKLHTVILDTCKPSDLIIGKYITSAIRDFFISSQFSQFLEQTNILSQISHKRKISSLGAGGVKKEHAGFEVRDIHYTQYNRLCPIETPDGQSVGLVLNLASCARVNKYGFLEAPYRVIENGKITPKIEYIDANKEADSVISTSDQFFHKNTDLVIARHGSDFKMLDVSNVQYIDVKSSQAVSVVTSLIPFLEHNEPTRGLFGCNMQKQAVPLCQLEQPFVGTGMEKVIAKDSIAVIIAKQDGIVRYVDSDTIIVDSFDKDSLSVVVDIYKLRKFEKTNQDTCIDQVPCVNIGQVIKKGDILTNGYCVQSAEVSVGKNVLVGFMPWRGYNFEDSIVISDSLVKQGAFDSIHIEVFECRAIDTKRGPEEFTNEIPINDVNKLRYLDESGIIQIGKVVKPGDILIGKTSPKEESISGPEEKLLRAIFGDKVLDKKDTSLYASSGVYGTVIGSTVLTKRGFVKKGRAKAIERDELEKRKTEYDMSLSIISQAFDGFIKENFGDIKFFYKGKLNTVSEGLLNKALLSKTKISFENKELLNDPKFDKAITNYQKAVYKLYDDYNKDVNVIMDGDDLPSPVLSVARVYVAVKSKLQPGDKMSGRHGNKGVISVVLPKEDMPYMSDGRSLDVVLSPISVPGRMNVGQILETHLGLVSYGMGKQITEMIENKQSADNIKKFIHNVLEDDTLKNKFDEMSDENFMQYVGHYKKGMYFELPVFNSPSHEKISSLSEKLGYSSDCQVDLYDGLTGEKFDRKVTVGYMYMMKLHHLVDGKMHARSVGPYSLVSQQPLGGKSYFGGQRLGEMECWALQAYGAANTLREMLTVKSDDVQGRQSTYQAITRGQNKFKIALPESFNVLVKELNAMGFDIELGRYQKNEEQQEPLAE